MAQRESLAFKVSPVSRLARGTLVAETFIDEQLTVETGASASHRSLLFALGLRALLLLAGLVILSGA